MKIWKEKIIEVQAFRTLKLRYDMEDKNDEMKHQEHETVTEKKKKG